MSLLNWSAWGQQRETVWRHFRLWKNYPTVKCRLGGMDLSSLAETANIHVGFARLTDVHPRRNAAANATLGESEP